tara:strand:- start:99 stop:1133 length:1035 start_codon:yes stop_codon:yes gene_type:complete
MSKKLFVTLREAEKIVKNKISTKIFNWLQSGAEDSHTYLKNFEDLKNIKIKPSHLTKFNALSTESIFFKKKISSPIILSPMGHQTQFHKEGEIEMARGVAKAKTIAFFGTQSRMKLSDIRKVNKNTYIGWTIFPFGDKQWIKKQIVTAEKNKCVAIAVCIDANVRSHRYSDRETRYDARKIGKRTNPISPNPKLATSYDWNLIKFIKRNSSLPIIVKGVVTVEDAKNALKSKADGIWISNHGGRMFNSGISCVDAIKDIKKTFKNKKMIVIVDGAVRKGSDIIKYMSLGADFVGVGRPAIHGLAVAGNRGVTNIFEILKNELLTSMVNGGFKNFKSFKRSRLIL